MIKIVIAILMIIAVIMVKKLINPRDKTQNKKLLDNMKKLK